MTAKRSEKTVEEKSGRRGRSKVRALAKGGTENSERVASGKVASAFRGRFHTERVPIEGDCKAFPQPETHEFYHRYLDYVFGIFTIRGGGVFFLPACLPKNENNL